MGGSESVYTQMPPMVRIVKKGMPRHTGREEGLQRQEVVCSEPCL